MGSNTRRLLRALALVLALVALGGCSSSDQDGGGDGAASDDGGDGAADVGGDDGSADDGGDGDASDGGGDDGSADDGGDGGEVAPSAAALPDIGRDIIYTAVVELEVDDLALATAEARRTVAALGGLLASQRSDAESSLLVFRVLPADFATALDRLAELGTVESQEVSSDDVTERVVDLQSRITTAAASVERLRGFLAGATDLATIADLENQLLDRETVLEQLRGQLRTLEGQVDLATITASIRRAGDAVPEPAIRVAAGAYAGHDGGAGCADADDRIELDRGDELSLCLSVTNTGDIAVTVEAVEDAALDLRLRDFAIVDGSLDEPLAPGATVALVHQATPDAAVSWEPAVRARAVGPDGAPLDEAVTGRVDPVRVVGFGGLDLPGFGDALDGSWRALQTLVGLVVLAVGLIIPFLWIIPAGLAVRWLVGRRGDRSLVDTDPPPLG